MSNLMRTLAGTMLLVNSLEAGQNRFYHTSEPRLNNENVDYSGNSTPLVSAGNHQNLGKVKRN